MRDGDEQNDLASAETLDASDELDSVERELKGLLDAADLGTPNEPEPVLGETIAETYTLTALLGEGGMGKVYRAEHARTGGQVALKLIKTSRLGDSSSVRRFELEAQHTASLHHPNIVRVFDYGRDDDLVYLAMEYVPGRSLEKLLVENGPLDWPVAVEIARQVLKALAAAHDSEQQIIHRDIKPANILVTDQDDDTFVKVLDFGIARALEGPSANTQGIIGSPQSMAPEQFDGGPLSPATDLYALGCTTYAMLTGRPPFEGTFSQLAVKHCHEEPPPLGDQPSATDVPDAFVDWVGWLMRKAPEDRPADARQALDELARQGDTSHVADEHPPAHTRGWARRLPLLVGGVGILASAALVLLNPSNPDKPDQSAAERSGHQDVGVRPADTGLASAIPVEPPPETRVIEDVSAKPGHVLEVSRQGNFAAYSSERVIYVHTLSTDETTEIEIPDDRELGAVSWFPDGARLLVSLTNEEQSELWTLNLLNRRWERLLPDAYGGTVSADGTRIAFVHDDAIHVANVDGKQVRSVKTFSKPRRLQRFQWYDTHTLIVAVHDMSARRHVIGALDTMSGNLTKLIENRRLSIGGPIPFAVTKDLFFYGWAPERRAGAGTQVRAVKLTEDGKGITGRPRVLLDGVEDAFWYSRFSSTRDGGALFLQRNRTRRRLRVAKVHRQPWRLEETSVSEDTVATRWISDDVRVSRAWEDGDTVLTRSAAGEASPETIGRVEDRIVRLQSVGPDRSMFGFEREAQDSDQARLVWLEAPLRHPEKRVVLSDEMSRDEPPNVKCTKERPPRCYFIRHRSGRIEVSQLTPKGIEGEPFLSIAGPAQQQTNAFDLRAESPALIVADHKEVGIYDMDGARKATWRPEGAGERYHLQSVEWDPKGGFFVSGIFPRDAMYRLLHVSEDGEVATLRESPDTWHLLGDVSPGGTYLSFTTMSWEGDLLKLSLTTEISDG